MSKKKVYNDFEILYFKNFEHLIRIYRISFHKCVNVTGEKYTTLITFGGWEYIFFVMVIFMRNMSLEKLNVIILWKILPYLNRTDEYNFLYQMTSYHGHKSLFSQKY